MDYKKKLKSRLYIAIIYIALGVIMIVGVFPSKADNDFISSFGFALIIMGIVRIRNYFMITKDDETIRKQWIAETDERNLSILHKAKVLHFPSIFCYRVQQLLFYHFSICTKKRNGLLILYVYSL